MSIARTIKLNWDGADFPPSRNKTWLYKPLKPVIALPPSSTIFSRTTLIFNIPSAISALQAPTRRPILMSLSTPLPQLSSIEVALDSRTVPVSRGIGRSSKNLRISVSLPHIHGFSWSNTMHRKRIACGILRHFLMQQDLPLYVLFFSSITPCLSFKLPTRTSAALTSMR